MARNRKRKLVECASLGIKMFEGVAQEVDALMKSLPASDRKLHRKSYDTVLNEKDELNRSEVSVITTQDVDLEGDIVIAKGIDRSYYDRSPCIFYAHDQSIEVGRCKWIKPLTNGLLAKSYYPPKPDWYEGQWEPDDVFARICSGMLQGKSIGFVPVKMRSATAEEVKLNPEWKDGRIIEKCWMFEYSVCIRGMNPNTNVEEVAKAASKPRKQLTESQRLELVKQRLKALSVDDLADRVVSAILNRGKV